jgi:foldase protein PrsA
MGEGNHLSTADKVAAPKKRWMWLCGGAAIAVVSAGLLMQYVLGTATKAATDPPAGTARVGGPAKKTDRALAKVGGETISYEAVAEECVKRFGREVLDDFINRMIIQQACEAHKITVKDEEISQEIDRIARKFGLDPTQWLQMLQAERNITPMQYRQSIIFPMIALKKLAGEEVDITEQELKEAYVRNYGPRVKARMIMFDNQRRATECYDMLMKDPDDFEKLASAKSVDPGSRALGGQIPPIAKYSGNEHLEKPAFKLKEGEISGVIEVAPSRWVILKCEGRTEPAVTSIDQVRDPLVDDLKEQKIQAKVAEVFEKLKKDTIVDNYLTNTTNRPERTAIGQEQTGGVQPASGTQTRPGSPTTRGQGGFGGGQFGGSGADNSATAPSKTGRK